MQRIESLVEKLVQQLHDKAQLAQLLATTQMLEKEIAGSMKETQVLGTNGIAVMVPNVPHLRAAAEEIIADEPELEKEIFELQYDEDAQFLDEEEELTPIENKIPLYTDLYSQNGNGANGEGKNGFKKSSDSYRTSAQFNSLDEIPTFAQQDKILYNKLDINNHKENKIKDLRKSINQQDRAAFIRELFRGDEVMYERSIKTINNFSIYAEADYWIKRELKTKIGWLPDDATVAYFEQLVKRRFS